MNERTARAIARWVHKGQQTSGGSSLFDHVERVAGAVPKHPRVTAWLHEALERTDLTIGQLRAQGMSPAELSSLLLLTRPKGCDYRYYVQRVADAPGPPGALARVVKLADLEDHLANPSCAPSSPPPYDWALRLILCARPQIPAPMRELLTSS
jgi:hypothetical protein